MHKQITLLKKSSASVLNKIYLKQILFVFLFLISFITVTSITTANENSDSTKEQSAKSKTNTTKVATNHLYVMLSDAIDAYKSNNLALTSQLLSDIEKNLILMPKYDSELGNPLKKRLSEAMSNPNIKTLSQLSQDLYNFEKALNPVDYSVKKKEFKASITPVYTQLAKAIETYDVNNIVAIRTAYDQFNREWLKNERVIRNTSVGHYGRIETAVALLRVALETKPVQFDKLHNQSANLKKALDSYNSGEEVDSNSNLSTTLNDGIILLKNGLSAFQDGDAKLGKEKLTSFIDIWPVIEADVITRSNDLYSRVESQIPTILAHGNNIDQQGQLANLIQELDIINLDSQYNALDAMLILLREGLEALFIVIALVSASNVTQHGYKRWIYGGAMAGIVASILSSWALYKLFSGITAGTNREIIEGFIGILTVIIMIFVGAWLHNKSNLQIWKNYIKSCMNTSITISSLLSLSFLSFLAVFREGAETILFYVGILPKISNYALFSGIFMGISFLAIVAFVLFRLTVKVSITQLFRILSFGIYLLAFKMLGVSLHSLQLTGYLPINSLNINWLNNSFFGIYPTVETLTVQMIYLSIIALIYLFINRKSRIISNHMKEQKSQNAITQ